jgi:hypothetical protein
MNTPVSLHWRSRSSAGHCRRPKKRRRQRPSFVARRMPSAATIARHAKGGLERSSRQNSGRFGRKPTSASTGSSTSVTCTSHLLACCFRKHRNSRASSQVGQDGSGKHQPIEGHLTLLLHLLLHFQLSTFYLISNVQIAAPRSGGFLISGTSAGNVATCAPPLPTVTATYCLPFTM